MLLKINSLFCFKNLYLFLVIIFSGLAISFYRSQGGLIILFFITIFYLLKYNINVNDKRLLITVILWLTYCIFIGLFYSTFVPFFIFRYIVYFLVAFTIFSLYGNYFFILFEKFIYILCLINLLFWIAELFFPAQVMSLASMLDISDNINPNADFYSNFFFRTIYWIKDNGFFPRNSGFCWEPGPFSIFIVFTLLLTYFRYPKSFYHRFSFWVLFISLLTTQSTTGIGAFLIVTFYLAVSRSKNESRFIVFLTLLVIISFIFFAVPFLFDKIQDLYIGGSNVDTLIDRSKATGKAYSAGRFGGVVLAYKNFLERPIFGTGGISLLSVGVSDKGTVYSVSGLATVLSTFGIVGLLLYLYFAFKSSVYISTFFGNGSKWAFFILFISCSFGFNVIHMPVLFAFILMSPVANNGNHLLSTSKISLGYPRFK